MIDPLSLNEAQGLTVEMLRAYVEENQLGIQVRDDLGAELDTLSLLTGKSIQELLREMNPRMVEGNPSERSHIGFRESPWWIRWRGTSELAQLPMSDSAQQQRKRKP